MAEEVIFIRQGADLIPLAIAPYEVEAILQDLLEKHSQILPGAQMRPSNPRRFLLVSRELAVPDREDGGGRWKLDHLFLDQDAIPTLVEVKRSSDTRIRRDVIGQMLDYAANGPRYWATSELRRIFEQTCQKAGVEPGQRLGDIIGENSDVDEFWSKAERNLRGGQIRLLFVADAIPDELLAIIEFLNRRMIDTEIFGVEVRRYIGPNGTECFVPRLVGKVATPETDMRSAQPLAEKLNNAGPAALALRGKLEEWARENGLSFIVAANNYQVCDNLGPLVRLNPWFRSLVFPLEVLWTAGRADDISWVVGEVQHLSMEKKVTDRKPSITPEVAMDQWDAVLSILGRLKAIRSEIGAQSTAD